MYICIYIYIYIYAYIYIYIYILFQQPCRKTGAPPAPASQPQSTRPPDLSVRRFRHRNTPHIISYHIISYYIVLYYIIS